MELNNLKLEKGTELLTIKKVKGKPVVFDIIRNKYVALTPEELVRQLIITHLVNVMNYPKNKISVELSLEINNLRKRCDILVFDTSFNPFLLIECKAHEVKLDHKVFQQLAIYNFQTKVPYFLMTNGIKTFVGKINYNTGAFDFQASIPDWNSL